MFAFLSRIFSKSSDIPTFQTIAIFQFLVVIVHVSHLYNSVDHTYAFIILFLVFILMCRPVIVFNIELNAPLSISIIFKISPSHFPFDVIVGPKYSCRSTVSLFDDITINIKTNFNQNFIFGN